MSLILLFLLLLILSVRGASLFLEADVDGEGG